MVLKLCSLQSFLTPPSKRQKISDFPSIPYQPQRDTELKTPEGLPSKRRKLDYAQMPPLEDVTAPIRVGGSQLQSAVSAPNKQSMAIKIEEKVSLRKKVTALIKNKNKKGFDKEMGECLRKEIYVELGDDVLKSVMKHRKKQ